MVCASLAPIGDYRPGFSPVAAQREAGTGLGAFANAFNRFSDQRVRLEEAPARIYWHIERCPVCWGRHTDRPACHLAVGILQEALHWVSSGRHFLIEETRCIAQGDPTCTIVIEKRSVE
jgi:predicted hydrocarbon binding protein